MQNIMKAVSLNHHKTVDTVSIVDRCETDIKTWLHHASVNTGWQAAQLY
jgi:hypothetical protein